MASRDVAEGKVKNWYSRVASLESLRIFWLDLFTYGILDDSPYKAQLEEILGGLDRVHKYKDSLTHYRPEIEKLQKTLDNAYSIVRRLREYGEKGFGKNFKTNSRISETVRQILEKENIGDEKTIIERDIEAALEDLEKYKPSASPLDMPEERKSEESTGKKKEKKLGAEIVAIALILVLSLGFATLRYASNAQLYAVYTGSQMPTGSFFIPTSMAGASFEAFYVTLASTVLAIYILGKLMNRW